MWQAQNKALVIILLPCFILEVYACSKLMKFVRSLIDDQACFASIPSEPICRTLTWRLQTFGVLNAQDCDEY